MKELVLGCLLAGSAACVASAAGAAPLVAGSSIDFGGYMQGSGGDGTLGNATGIDFVSGTGGTASPGTAGTIATYGSGTGTFAGVSCMSGACGTIRDIPTLTASALDIANFLTLSGGSNALPIAFDLSAISGVNRSDAQFLTFRALGTIRYAGFDATPASFLFSAQGNIATFFSATALAAAVPESASWAMMCLGVGMMGFALRRRPAKARIRFA